MHGLKRLALRIMDSVSTASLGKTRHRSLQRPAICASVQVLDTRILPAATAGLELVVTNQPPSTVTAGEPFSVTVKVQNADGVTQTDFTGQVSVAEYYYGTISGDLTVTAVNGTATFNNLSLTTAVSDDFLVFYTSGSVASSVNSSLIQVNAAPAAKLLVSSPATLLDGATFNLNVVALDNFGNTAKSFQGDVTVALSNNPSSATLGGTLVVTAANGIAKFSGLTVNKPGVGYTLAVTAPGVTTGTTQPFNVVSPLVVTKQPPTSVDVGTPFDVVVKVVNVNGAVNSSYNGTVTVSASTFYNGLNGVLSVTAVNGVATFTNLRLSNPANAVALHFTGTGLVSGEVTSTAVQVKAVPATKLIVSPVGVLTAGTPFTLKVFAQDDFGNTVTSFSGPVTIALQSSVANAVLGGTVTVSAVNGLATFSNLTINQPGTGYRLNVSSAGLASAVTPEFNVGIRPNHAPVGASNTVTTREDQIYVFKVSDFPFSDPNDNPQNAFQAIVIQALPNAGKLTLGGVVVTVGQAISVADLSAGKLQFTPTANKNGAGYASFTFRVKDNGGTANAGVDLDPTSRVLTINVTPVNDAPVGASKTVTGFEDKAYVFKTSDFALVDANDSPQNSLLGVLIRTLPIAGRLTLSGVAVSVGQTISVADLSAGKLQFTPTANKSGTGYASFTFRVKDNGGTANGGVDVDPTSRVMTINVTSVNDAPVGASKTVTGFEDKAYVFKTSDFALVDANDSPQNSLLGVLVRTLPSAGKLMLSGVAVTAGQTISVADLSAGKFQFKPTANKNGMGYASFTFRVKDNGGTANGGLDLDQTARVMTINVTSVNDAPVGVSKTVRMAINSVYKFAVSDFSVLDSLDTPSNSLKSIQIQSLPTRGVLRNAGIAVVVGQSISVADIAAGKLQFTPAPNRSGTNYASFLFRVKDNGGTANGGLDTDLTNRSITISVT